MIVVTGARGFIGRNLCQALARRSDLSFVGVDIGDEEKLEPCVNKADVIVHLAGVNRPEDPADFVAGNVDFTKRVTELAARCSKPPAIVLSSSIHAQTETAYGTSKRLGEEV